MNVKKRIVKFLPLQETKEKSKYTLW